MKIALMTSEESFLNNYGAVLQAYALTRVLKAHGDSCEIVRYVGGNPETSGLRIRMHKRCSKLYHMVVKTSAQKIQAPYRKGLKAQRHQFQKFQDDYLVFWNHFRKDWSQLKKNYPQADAYMCGSDQIWNPNYKQGHNDPGYFLEFAPAGKKRIAYAPSFACEDIPDPAKKTLNAYLSGFSAISVREPEGKEIISRYTDYQAQLVADPTFLLEKEQWEKIAAVPSGTPSQYILCYRFMKNDLMTECINRLSKELNLPVLTLPLPTSVTAFQDPYEKVFAAGPAEFVGLIQNAKLICTDSFHATAFSLIMNTPAYIFLDLDAAGAGTTMNSRIYNVVGMAGLENRIITSEDQLRPGEAYQVDFNRFNETIAKFRGESLTWLKNALEK